MRSSDQLPGKESDVYDLDGKVALVTCAGGERGIGRATAMRLAEEGADFISHPDLSGDGSTDSVQVKGKMVISRGSSLTLG